MAIVNANALIAGAGGTSNYCPNQTRVGIVAGTPGVLPTAHGFIGAISGLTQQVVGQGTDPVTGLPYYDIRLYGITTGTFLIPCFNNTAAYNTIVGGGVTQTFSVWAALVGGSLANVTTVGLQFRFNGGLPAVSAAQPITLTSSLTQFTQTAASTTGTVSVNSGLIFSWLVGAAIDMTLRFGPQQHEIGTGPTAQISPPAGTVALVTRALQAAPDVRAPPGIVYATCTIYGSGGVAAAQPTWIATTRATIPGAGGTTNYAPNPRLEGVVPGTPGTFPTSTGTSALGGLSTTVVGSGIDVTTGLPYFDVRFFGVSTQGFVLYYPIANAPWFNVPVASATWTFSTWVALVGGSLTNVSTNFLHQIRWNNGTPGLANFSFTPNATFTQYTTTGTSGTGTTTTQTDISLSCTIGQPVDLTLRFGPSQLELGSARTPQIWPPAGTPGWSARALLAAPDVLGPPGIQYANCTIYGAGGFAFNPVNSRFLAYAQINGTGGQTNWVRNPLSEGLIAGTPGTIPTFWWPWTLNGLSRDLSLQIINGEPFTVARHYGNTNVSGGQTFFVENQSGLPLMPMVTGQTVTFSVDLAIIAGSHPGPLFFTIGGVPLTSTFAVIGTGFQNDITAQIIATTTPRRYSVTYTSNDPTAAYVRFNILPIRGATVGQAIDYTLAVGYSQAEYGPVPTGFMLPLPGAPAFTTRPLLAAPVQLVSAACTINGTGGIATAEQVGLVAANLSTETGMVWDPTSILDPVNTTLSSDNRTVLHTDPTTSNFDGVRGILPPLGAGKYYAEFTPPGGATSWTASCSIGVCNINANYHSLYDTAANGCVFQPLYGIWVNGVDTGLLHNAWLNNETAAMAVDLDNERIWFRVLPSGLWNGTPGADPTIPSTGIDLSSIPLLQFDAFAEVNLANRSVEINAGSEPFRGAVPAGFVSWPAPGHVQATPRLVAQTAAEADGVGTLRATAVVRAAAGAVTIAGGEGNRLDQRTIPVPGISYTVVISTDIPPPPGVYTPVYLHTSISTADNAIGGVFTTNPTPFIPYRWGAWLYVPSSWTGVNILFQVEGAGTTAVQGFVSLATRDQWQYVTFETDAVANNNARLVCRGTTNPGGTLYTAGWTGIPDTVVGGAVSRETSVSRIAGTGGVIASAQVLAAARSTLPGVGGHLNFIRNPLHLGAVVGTPGTLPTFWTISLSGISQQVVGTGIDAATGLPYLDVRFFGTTSAGSSNIRFEAQIGGVPATNGETWTQSVYVMLAGGSLTNINGIGVQLYQTSATGVILGNTGATTVPVPVGALGRIVRSGTIATPGTLFNWPVLNLYHATPQPIDITLRLAGEQLELGSVATGAVQPPAGTTGVSSFGILNDARVLVSAACTIAGTGAIATAEQVGIVAAMLPGVGALQAQAAVTWRQPSAATLAGVGSLSANAGPLAPTGAVLAGVSNLLANAADINAVAALIPGISSLSADARPARPAVATLSGTGSVAADATPRRAAASQIPGAGVTNWIRNPRAEGAVLGTVGASGAFPTFWSRIGGAGCSADIVGTGITADGLPYLDFRLYGTTTGTFYILAFDSPPAIVTAPGDRWGFSVYVAVVGGSLSNISPVQLEERFSNATLGQTFTPTATLTRIVATPLAPAGAFNVTPCLSVYFSSGVAIDVTLRVAAPQSERPSGLAVSPLIWPPAGASAYTSRAVLPAPVTLAQASATLAGISDFDADGIRIAQTQVVGASFAGVGSFSATATAGGGAAALIAGTGGVLGAAVSRLLAQAGFPGVGSVSAAAGGLRPALARMAGLGSLRADAHPARAARSTIPGQGGVTNWIHNPRGANAVVGTFAPGQSTTNPPWWDTDVGNGLTREIVGNFTVDGVDVLRMRFYGVPDLPADPPWAFWLVANAAFEYTPEYTPGAGFLTKMPEGQVYTRSFYLRLAAGSWANTNNLTFWGILVDATGATIQPPVVTVLPPPGSAITRYTDTVTATGGTPPYQTIAFGLTIDRADPPAYIDVTFDIGGGQAELGSTLTALILPPPGQLGTPTTRALQAMPVTLVSAAARISGDSSVTVGAATQQRAAARIGGEGWLVAAAYSPAQQVISGEGYFVAISSQIIAAAGARLDGVGLVRAAGYSGVSYARARIDAVSDCWAEDYWLTSQPVTRLHGVGQLTGAPVANLIAGSAPTAISHLYANAMPTVFVGVRLWPEGNLIARPVALLGAAAKLGGVGTLAVRGLSGLGAARIAGTGQLTASASVGRLGYAVARIAGIGRLGAAPDLAALGYAAARIPGTGQLTADAIRIGNVYTAATLRGVGHLEARSNVPLRATARLAGVGQLVADGTLSETSGIHHGAALLAGIGRLVGRVPGRVQAAATIAGTGHLAGAATAHLIAGTAPTGISHLQVVLSEVFPAVMVGARIWPEGKLVALGSALLHTGATLAGLGTLQADAPESGSIAAQIPGTGHLDARASASRILAATLGSAGRLAADAIVLRPAAARLAGEGFLIQGDNDGLLFAAAHLGGEGTLAVDPGIATYESGALITGEGAFPADHPWDDEELRGTTGLPPIHVLAGAFAQIPGIGRLVAGNAPRALRAAALIAGEGQLTEYRGGGIHDEMDLTGQTGIRRSLTGMVRGAISLAGRLRPGAVLEGIVQGDQKK